MHEQNFKGKIAYDINTFCKAYSIGRTKTYEEINAGRLKIVKIGRKTLIPAVSAQAWFEDIFSNSRDGAV